MRFGENNIGVHLLTNEGRTLCGDAAEGDRWLGIEPCEPTTKKTVTCPRCIEIIELCRGVRTK